MNTTTSHTLILPKYLIKAKGKGRKISKTCAREGGASVLSLNNFRYICTIARIKKVN
jgi:hypothetical protein